RHARSRGRRTRARVSTRVVAGRWTATARRARTDSIPAGAKGSTDAGDRRYAREGAGAPERRSFSGPGERAATPTARSRWESRPPPTSSARPRIDHCLIPNVLGQKLSLAIDLERTGAPSVRAVLVAANAARPHTGGASAPRGVVVLQPFLARRIVGRVDCGDVVGLASSKAGA